MAGDFSRVDCNYDQNTKLWSETDALVKDLKVLMKDKDSCDVAFIVGIEKERFNAHSLILKVRCGKFRKWNVLPSSPSPALFSEVNFRPEVFKKVLEYIYTGKMEFTTTCTLEMLRIAHKLDVPDLILGAEHYFLEKLTVVNCCEFFMDSLSVCNAKDFESSASGDLVDKCRSFIEENAADVVKTSGFLNLSKEALIQLVSSDKFALPEEDVWYAVLRWAKHKAKVEKPVKNWSDQERKMVCEHLADVVGYVRLLLIDSTIFADEIEPTGAVPMELSLERYRFAAIPDKFCSSDDIRLKTRANHKLFQGTTILWKNNVKYQEILNKWFGNPHQEWDLLYKATTDGFSSQTFHQKCNGFSQTYTIVKGLNGHICGGFSDVPWRSDDINSKYIKSTRSFLFTIVNSDGIQPTKFDIVRSKYATLHHNSLGPCFGAGADLCLADECNTNLNSYSNMPHSYGGAVASGKLLMGDINFKVVDYEVFSAKCSSRNYKHGKSSQ